LITWEIGGIEHDVLYNREMEETDYRKEYLDVLDGLFKKYRVRFSEKKVGVLVSGGIDSSIIAVEVQKYFPDAVLLSLQSEKSTDDDFVEILGQYLKKQPILVQVNREQLIRAEPVIKQLLIEVGITVSPMQIALASVYYFLFQEARKREIEIVFTGQGPDILLAGYHKYQGLVGVKLKKQIVKDLVLLETDKKRDGKVAKCWSISTENPYLTKEFVEFALSVPAELLIKNGITKYLSRSAGKHLGLPTIIVERPKQAMQYSTGVQKLIK
jgi:asparagine synthase (glutamine-hydrolysing)